MAMRIQRAPAALVLSDNLFHDHDLVPQLAASNGSSLGATVYAYPRWGACLTWRS